MKWESKERHQFIASFPSEACLISRRVWRGYWQVFGLAGMTRQISTGASTDPSSRLQRKPVLFGCSFLLTAAGQFRIFTGFPLRVPLETRPASDTQHTAVLRPSQQNIVVFLHLRKLDSPSIHADTLVQQDMGQESITKGTNDEATTVDVDLPQCGTRCTGRRRGFETRSRHIFSRMRRWRLCFAQRSTANKWNARRFGTPQAG